MKNAQLKSSKKGFQYWRVNNRLHEYLCSKYWFYQLFSRTHSLKSVHQLVQYLNPVICRKIEVDEDCTITTNSRKRSQELTVTQKLRDKFWPIITYSNINSHWYLYLQFGKFIKRTTLGDKSTRTDVVEWDEPKFQQEL